MAKLAQTPPLWYDADMATEPFSGIMPTLLNPAFVAASADLIGSVTLHEGSNVWYNTTLRGDVAPISIGKNSNVQDNCCIHVDYGKGCTLGAHVTVGHCVTLHACTVEDDCLIGMGAVVLDGAVIGHGSVVGAHALVTKNTVIPPYSLVLGSPAKVVKQLPEETAQANRDHAAEYVRLAEQYAAR